MAVLGSVVIVIVTSIIGYQLEKRKTPERIIHAYCLPSIADFVLEEDKKLDHRASIRLTNISYNRNSILYRELKEYYQGSFLKDEKLQNLINEKIIPYAEKVKNFQVIVATPNNESNNITKKFNDLWNSEQELDKHIDEWMKNKGFLLGKEFNIEDNQKEQENG
ncbi:MAG: hypothetical protein E7607_04650 [Ruminococcaceae bacterium]|nr:hypothetical protein [Oscillospiraceae bacterium]